MDISCDGLRLQERGQNNIYCEMETREKLDTWMTWMWPFPDYCYNPSTSTSLPSRVTSWRLKWCFTIVCFHHLRHLWFTPLPTLIKVNEDTQ
ncbi:hypothetical protein Pmani_027607 [Petrolisthes manimaculis]|uniref:Uncharacterized protein n=1 Tax=Petrolisthes manimaculis TaxID=1843537 RepID=A0AAE1P368_9EUCA|nr:hypothetical protein Pmani_027607 [Petrolisthes manimaculis]